MHKLERSEYSFASITEAFKQVFNMKQKDNENLLDHSKHLKQAKEILEAHVGKNILENDADNLNELKKATEAGYKNKIKHEEFKNGWCTY